MTMPAEITTDASWDRLNAILRAMYRDADSLYQRITDPEADEELELEETDAVSDPNAAYEIDDRDAETDGGPDGDYDTDAYDEPGLEE